MASAELQPFQGEWRRVELPGNVGRIGQDYFMVPTVEPDFYRRCALAVSVSAGTRLAKRPDDEAVTLLTRCMIDLPQPGNADPGVCQRALRDTLSLLGVRLMAAGNDPASMEAEAAIISGKLEGPAKIFARSVASRNRTAAEHLRHPQGVGYATVVRSNQQRGF